MMINCFGFLFLIFLPWSNSVILDVPGYATIKGGMMESFLEDKPIYSFFGLRYAQEPTIETRFKPPVPIGQYPDDIVINATFYGPRCLQGSDGKEDCLLLNVFTPELPNGTDPNIPVMFWIHGGSFTSGETLIYSPFALLDHRVVLVVIQYRLGPQGWLYLGTDDLPGNAGLYDMIEALRWVQKHIRAFGGDPNSVTIFGESAGGASVGLLMLCEPARGLFHRVIGHSGSAMVPWATDEDPIPKTIRIAEIAGCPIDNEIAMVQCLKTMDQHALSKARNRQENEDRLNDKIGFGGASAVVQRSGGIYEPLITAHPSELLASGNYINDVPVMFGANKHEGSFVLSVTHADELIYIYSLIPLLYNDTEEYITTRMTTLWTNFATYGNPTPDGIELPADVEKWLPYTDENPNWMSLDLSFTSEVDYTTTFTVAVDENFGSKKRKEIDIDLKQVLPFIPEGDEDYRFFKKSYLTPGDKL
ncbi:esterase FE4-like isoform X2 [Artemia franciscana]|uniref:esterase FE4-like isoform X2 n=1 Tax=Artemia franciscana TaxID=6661 RepID=UPI0032DB8772